MTVYVALLRAINVGGSGKLPMTDLAALCTGAAFTKVRTYIQSGNVVFGSRKAEAAVRKALEEALSEVLGKPAAVAVRTAAEMAALPRQIRFPKAPPARWASRSSTSDSARRLGMVTIPGKEEVVLGAREIYIHFPDGMGRSKLKLPKAFGPATVRNINTVRKLAAMAAEVGG